MATFCQYIITLHLPSLKRVIHPHFQGNAFMIRLVILLYQSIFSQHVNITKCRNYEFIPKAIDNLSFLTDLNTDDITFVIDNISATGDIGNRISIEDFLLKNKELLAHFNPESFPGCYIRYKSVTIGLFSSGKVIFVGARDFSDINDCFNWLKEKCKAVNT